MVCIFLRKSSIFKYIFLKKLENNTFKQTMKTFLVCLLLVQLFVACTIAQTNIPTTQQCLHEGSRIHLFVLYFQQLIVLYFW